ncbi:hypothetical protein WR164_14000 [Philodulcilactobacillus myokoensis]|uniref:Extracellular protein n=1 Tax=Philodulcilactobacillus myokoensis TaxID=2929573 RepID=A0A9W6ESU7_9LACO|nr:hypothetical protein [Philodulcilactobacillus myokoensis]GLB47421.1 hypothetical protein WR164_14000 [Philodulcilactobacillus myokoensis]
MKKYSLLIAAVVMAGGMAVTAPKTSLAQSMNQDHVATVNQQDNALPQDMGSNFHILDNHNYENKAYKYYYAPDNGVKHHLATIGGNRKVKFSSYLFLPNNIKDRKYDWGDVQSITSTPNGRYMYVLCNRNQSHHDNDYDGWIVRYDMGKLRQMGIAGRNVAKLRRISYLYFNHKINHFNKQQRKVISAVKVGPHFTTGHGQSLSYNPKNHQLWLIRIGKIAQTRAAMVEIGTSSLKPIKQIDFQFNNNYPISDFMTFDKNGNAYTFTRSMNSFIKIYQGRITNDGVHFHLIQQGLKHWPGQNLQGMAYNQRTNRIYIVADGGIMSMPVNKLGHLKNADVYDSKISGHREFEGLTFDKQGHGYLLVHLIPEIMKSDRIL